MAQQRDDRAIIALQRKASLAAVRLDGCGMVVESTQRAFAVALDVGSVRRAPVHARTSIAKEMEGAATERIAALARVRTYCRKRDAQLLIRVARLCDHIRIVGREWKAMTIVDGPTRDLAHDVEHARIVGEPSPSVSLHAEMRSDHIVVAMND